MHMTVFPHLDIDANALIEFFQKPVSSLLDFNVFQYFKITHKIYQ